MAHRPFTAYDPDWNLVCLLCVELPDLARGTARPWTAPDGAPGLAATYRIRDGATWGDGTPVTAEDALFTWQLGRDAEVGANNQEMYRRMERLEVQDAKTFTIYWNERRCDYRDIGDFQIVPAHLERARYAAGAREYRNRTAYETDTANPGLWFGPYRVTKVEPGALVVLERNPTWWGAPARFKRVTFRVVENTAALESNLLSGAIDYVAGEDGFTLDQALALAKRHADRFVFVYKPGLTDEHIDLNLDNPILADARVRRALLHAINRDAISRRLFEGRQPVAHGSVHPLDPVHVAEVPTYAYDPDRAARLLSEAGWSTPRDGVRRNARGEALALDFATTAGNRVRELVAQAVQSDLKRVGIEVRIKNEPARVLFGETLPERRFGGMAMYASVVTPGYVPFGALHSSMIPTAANGFAGDNYPGYRNAAMDEALERLQVACDAATQAALWRRVQTLQAEDLPALPLYFRADPFVLPKWLKGVRPTGHGNPSTLWVEEWRAE